MTQQNSPDFLSTELLTQVIDTNATGIIIVDNKNSIIFWNQWIENASNINKKSALNKSLFSVFPEIKNSRIDKAIKLSILKGNASFISHAFNKKPFPLYTQGNKKRAIRQLTYIKPIHLENNERYCFIQINDASNSFYREQQLRKMAYDANALSQLKSGFVSSVSHELRTPLTSIMGSIGLLKSGIEDPSSNNFKNMIDIAYNNADRLLLLINDILDIEKIESGKMEFKFSDVDLNEIIESCLTHNSGLAEKYHVSFNFKKHAHLPIISVDKDRVFQVLNNLLSNAAKFEPNNGVIDVETTLEKNFIQVAITDHGTGIPAEFKDRIFDAFTQADVSNTKGVAGTGLGLAITKTIIELHKGKIHFNSIPNKSTCFYFTLPIS